MLKVHVFALGSVPGQVLLHYMTYHRSSKCKKAGSVESRGSAISCPESSSWLTAKLSLESTPESDGALTTRLSPTAEKRQFGARHLSSSTTCPISVFLSRCIHAFRPSQFEDHSEARVLQLPLTVYLSFPPTGPPQSLV